MPEYGASYGTSVVQHPNSVATSAGGSEDTKYVKPSEQDDDGYVKCVRDWFMKCKEKQRDTVEREDEDFKFYSGHQWKDEEASERNSQKRPTLTLNYVLPIVNAVVGEERLNRQQIMVYGRNMDDDAGAFAMTELLRWVMQTCNGDYTVSRAFRSAVICGRGWLGVGLDYLNDPAGKIDVRYIPRNEIHLDHLSSEDDASDARYLIHEKWLPCETVKAMWPEHAEELTSVRDIVRTTGKQYQTRGDAYKGKSDVSYNQEDDTFQVLECWHYEIQPGAVVANQETNQLEELTLQQFDALDNAKNQEINDIRDANDQAALLGQAPVDLPPPLQSIKRPIKVFYQGFVCGKIALERNKSPHLRLKRYPYVPVFGMRDEDKKEWFGIVAPIKDPQTQHNVEQSAILHWTQTMPKSGWMAPKGSFVDRTKWEQRSSQAGFIGEYNGNRGKPEQIRPPTVPRHVLELSPTRLQNMRDISGVNVDLMGNTVKDTAGVVVEMRRKQALTVLQTFFDNLRLSRRILGEILIHFVQQYISDGRKVRVVGERGVRYVIASGNLQFNEYDAVIEDAPDSPTDKLATMHIMQTTLPMLLKAGLPIPPSFVDLLPISPHIRDEWKAMLQPPGLDGQMGAFPAGPPTPTSPTGMPQG